MIKKSLSLDLLAAVLVVATILSPRNAAGQTVATVATSGKIYKVEIDAHGNWVVTSTVATNAGYSYGLSCDPHGNTYYCDTPAGNIVQVPPGGTPMTVASNFNYPSGLTIGADGHLIVAVFGSGCVSEVQPGGNQGSIACGLDGPVSVRPYWQQKYSRYSSYYGYSDYYGYYDAYGYYGYYDDYYDPRGYYDPQGYLTTYRGGSPGGVNLVSRNPDGTWTNVQTIATGLNLSYDAVPDRAGNVFVSELGNYRILEFPAIGNGAVSTNLVVFATNLAPIGLAFDYVGNLYEADFGGAINKFVLTNGALNPNPITVISGLNQPTYIAFPPPPIVRIQRAGGNVVLTWPDALFALQTANAPTAPFAPVPGASSPYTNPVVAGTRFFRLLSK